MRGFKIYWVVAGVLLLIYIIVQFNQPKHIDWRETLSDKEKIPYGTYILKNRLADIFSGSAVKVYRQPVYNVIAEDSVKNATYIVIAKDLEISGPDYDQLVTYVKGGNDVFFAAEDFGGLLEKKLKVRTGYNDKAGGKPSALTFTNKYLKRNKYSLDRHIGNVYFKAFDTVNTIVLGENNMRKANYIKIAIGKGSLYLMANPLIFTNYSLLQTQGSAYASMVLSYLKTTKAILLDEYYTQGGGGGETPMRVFLTNPILEWAYYITIFSLLLFVVYDIKRRQRIIPVIAPLTNSTLEFVTVIGQLYYEKRDNADIAKKKIVYLSYWLRDKYRITANIFDEGFSEILIQKLNFKPEFAIRFTGFINYVYANEMVTDKELLELNRLADQFYNQAK